MDEKPQASGEGGKITVAALALPEGWSWVVAMDSPWQGRWRGVRLPEKLTPAVPARLMSPKGREAARAYVPLPLVEAYEEGFVTAAELVGAGGEQAGLSDGTPLSAEFRTVAELRLPAPADPSLLGAYVEFCCEAAALKVVAAAGDAMSRAAGAAAGKRIPEDADRATIQQALAATDAAMEYAATCKVAICAALKQGDSHLDLIDTIARASARQTQWLIDRAEPGDDGLGAKFLEAEFDGVEVELPEYLDYFPARKWKTDRELAWKENPELEEEFWARVAAAQLSGAEEPTLADERREPAGTASPVCEER